MARLIVGIGAGLALAAGIGIWLLTTVDEHDVIARDPGAGADPSHAETAPAVGDASNSAAENAADPTRDFVTSDPVGTPSTIAWLAELGTVTGRVVDVDHRPVAGMALRALPRSERELDPRPLSPPVERAPLPTAVTTDPDGRFTLTGLVPRDRYLLVLDPAGSRVTSLTDVTGPALETTIDLGDLVAQPNMTITGRVVSNGAPVAGASVGVPDAGKPGDEWIAVLDSKASAWIAVPFEVKQTFGQMAYSPAGVTDADGRFALTGLFRSDDVLAIRAPQRATFAVACPNSTTDLGAIELPRGESIRGRVVDQDGASAGATVFAGSLRAPATDSTDPYSQMDPYAWSLPEALRLRRQLRSAPTLDAALLDPIVTTGSDGMFDLAGIELPALVLARYTDGRPSAIVRVDDVGNPIELAPAAAHDLRVTLTSAGGAAPAETMLTLSRIIAEQTTQTTVLRSTTIDLRDRVDGDGSARPVVRRLAPGTYGVRATATDHGIASAEVVIGDADADVKLELPVERELLVRAVDADGRPVRGALVAVRPVTYVSGRSLRRASARTNMDGVARLAQIGQFPMIVSADHPQYARAETTIADPAPAVVDVVLERGGTLELRVHRDGAPPKKRWQITLARRDKRMSTSFYENVALDAAGNGRREQLVPGTYEATMAEDSTTAAAGERPPLRGVFFSFSQLPKRGVVIESGATSTVTFDERETQGYVGPTARLAGRVMVNGVPPANMRVSLRLQATWGDVTFAPIAADGTYEFAEAPAGVVMLGISTANAADRWGSNPLAQRQVELTAGTDVRVDFELRTGRVAGRIEFADDGSPAAGASVRLNQADDGTNSNGYFSREATANADGMFVIESIVAGTYTSSIDHPLAPSQAGPTIDVAIGAEVVAPTIRMRRGVTVTGKCLDEAGKVPQIYGIHIQCQQPIAGFSFAFRQGEFDTTTGAFKFEGVAPGKCLLSAYSESAIEELALDVPETGLSGVIYTVKSKSVTYTHVTGTIELPSATAPQIASLHCWGSATGGGNASSSVNSLTRAFAFERITPGTYVVNFMSISKASYEQLTLEVPAEGLTDVVLRPKLAQQK